MSGQSWLDSLEERYLAARRSGDVVAMKRLQNRESCYVLLAILRALAQDETSFVHQVAVKGGILMAGELGSLRSSADIDATHGRGRRLDADRIESDIRSAGRELGLRMDGGAQRTHGGWVFSFRFDTRTDRGIGKLEISSREDLVLEVREAVFNSPEYDLQPFTVPALAPEELVAEKLRTMVQRDQPRDLFDLWFYLTQSGWHLDRERLRRAVDGKLSGRHSWQPGLWRSRLPAIERLWAATLREWLETDQIPEFNTVVEQVGRRLKELGLD